MDGAEVKLTPAAVSKLSRVPAIRAMVYRNMIAELERPREDYDLSGIKDASNVLAYLIGQDISEDRMLLLAASKAILEQGK